MPGSQKFGSGPVEGAHPQGCETGPRRPRLVADRVDAAKAEKRDAQAVALYDRGPGRLVEVLAGPGDRDALLAQKRERVLEPDVATVEHVVVGARHHVEAHLAEHRTALTRRSHEVLVARRLGRSVRVDPFAVAEHDVGCREQRLAAAGTPTVRRARRGTRPRLRARRRAVAACCRARGRSGGRGHCSMTSAAPGACSARRGTRSPGNEGGLTSM